MKGFLFLMGWIGFFILSLRFIVDIFKLLKKSYMKTKRIEVIEYLAINKNDLIDHFKDKYKDQISKLSTYRGFVKQEFINHLDSNMRSDLRHMFISKFDINIEQAMELEAEDEIHKYVIYIIKGSLA